MKKVLLISRCPPEPLHLGDRLIIDHLARQLALRGYSIDLLAFANRAEDWDTDWSALSHFSSIRLFAEPERSPSAYLQRLLRPAARFPNAAEAAWSLEMWRAIETQLASDAYDVVHLFGGVQVYEFYNAVKRFPTLIVPYESYSLYLRRALDAALGMSQAALANRLRLWVTQQYERFMFSPYQRVVVVSEQDRDQLLALNPALPVEVIPNGVDTAYFAPIEQIERDSKTLLFVGNFEYAPNVDAAFYLIEHILPAVRRQFPDVKLQLVGNAPPPELLNRAQVSIEITGRVPDVRPYLARATIFVCPLRMGAGIKNKVLEALAMGCPVVATPLSVDGIAVRAGVEALIAPVDGAGGVFEEAVISLLEDHDLRNALSQAGRKLIEARYSWAYVADCYEELYSIMTADKAMS